MAEHFRRDFETVEEYHARLEAEAAERATFEPDIGKVLDGQQTAPLTIKPGHHHYMAALRAGREDEYSDRMKARYGGEW